MGSRHAVLREIMWDIRIRIQSSRLKVLTFLLRLASIAYSARRGDFEWARDLVWWRV
jgi:hypothetical protein